MNMYVLIGYHKSTKRREFWFYMPAENEKLAVEYWREAEPMSHTYENVSVWRKVGALELAK